MSITYPIGYPTHNPMNTPTMHPNRGRIARIESSRIESSPLDLWSSSTTSTSYVMRAERVEMVATR